MGHTLVICSMAGADYIRRASWYQAMDGGDVGVCIGEMIIRSATLRIRGNESRSAFNLRLYVI